MATAKVCWTTTDLAPDYVWGYLSDQLISVTFKMETTDYYQREKRAIFDLLAKKGCEMTYFEILLHTQISTIIAVSAMADLLRSGKIIYRIKDGVQYFSINESQQP